MDGELHTQIAELLRGTQEVLVESELVKKLKRGKPLRIKAGFDPDGILNPGNVLV